MNGFDLIIEPDSSDPEAAEVLVDALVGDRKYRFLLDTGAAATAVLFDEYTSNFEPIDRTSSSGVFASKSEELIRVPRIKLGPLQRDDFTVVRMESTHGRNLIGMDLLKDFALHFLFNEARVEVVDQYGGDGLATRDLLLGAKFHPYVEVSFDGDVAAAVWDTGAGITVADSSFIEARPRHFQAARWSEGTDSTGAQMRTQMFVMSGGEIGGRMFPPHTVAAVDLSYVNSTTEIPMNLILGYSTLSKANWMLDFNLRKWGISSMLAAP